MYNSHVFNEVSALEVRIICELGPNNQYIYGRLNEVEIYGPQGPTLPQISTTGEMLHFNTVADLQQTLDYLEYMYEEHSESFYSQYTNLTDDELELVEEQQGFNDNQPYIDFENTYGIYSLRAKIAEEEDIWLSTTAGDSTAGPDPDDQFGMFDYEMRTVLNHLGEIRVGNQTYTFYSNGTWDINTGGGQGGGGLTEPEMTAFATQICRNWVITSSFKENSSSDWRIKMRTSFFNPPLFNAGVKGITISYKRKNGRWKRSAAEVYVALEGNITNDSDCSQSQAIQREKYGRRRKVRLRIPCQNCKVRSEEVFSVHWSSRVPTFYYQTLKW